MSISEQAKTQLIGLIYEGESLDTFDSEAFYSWAQASYEALEFDPVQRERFAKYCRLSYDATPATRLHGGVWILKSALHKEAPEDDTSTYSQL